MNWQLIRRAILAKIQSNEIFIRIQMSRLAAQGARHLRAAGRPRWIEYPPKAEQFMTWYHLGAAAGYNEQAGRLGASIGICSLVKGGCR